MSTQNGNVDKWVEITKVNYGNTDLVSSVIMFRIANICLKMS